MGIAVAFRIGYTLLLFEGRGVNRGGECFSEFADADFESGPPRANRYQDRNREGIAIALRIGFLLRCGGRFRRGVYRKAIPIPIQPETNRYRDRDRAQNTPVIHKH